MKFRNKTKQVITRAKHMEAIEWSALGVSDGATDGTNDGTTDGTTECSPIHHMIDIKTYISSLILKHWMIFIIIKLE